MRAKVIYLPGADFDKSTKRPLTRLMIVALIEACERQHKGLLFGPGNIKGSLLILIKRGLVASKEIMIGGKRESIWEVTPEAVKMLKDLGIDVPC